MKVLVTGATGFVEKALVNSLIEASVSVVAVVRQYSESRGQPA